MLPKAFQCFLEQRPICVMAQAVLENFFQPQHLDALFERAAQRQYTRTLLFSALIDLMFAVVLCIEPSVYAAYRLRKKCLRVSDQAVYDKLDGMELGVSAALVEDSAQRAAAVIDALGARRKPWLRGYRVRILDGNHLSGTEHRLQELRTTWAAALPGKVLDVIDPETGLSTQVFLTPDGHAQERSLLDEVLAKIDKRDLWIADRNFCTLKFLFGIAAAEAFFLIRQHGTLQGRLRGRRRLVGLGPSGKVYEQAVELTYEGVTRTLRRITVELTQPGDADAGVRDRHAGLSEGGVAGLLPGAGGGQRGGRDQGRPAGRAWGRGGRRAVRLLPGFGDRADVRRHDGGLAAAALGAVPRHGAGVVRGGVEGDRGARRVVSLPQEQARPEKAAAQARPLSEWRPCLDS